MQFLLGIGALAPLVDIWFD